MDNIFYSSLIDTKKQHNYANQPNQPTDKFCVPSFQQPFQERSRCLYTTDFAETIIVTAY